MKLLNQESVLLRISTPHSAVPVYAEECGVRFFELFFILESHKKVKYLFIAPKARQILHKTAQRALSTM